MVDAQPAAGEGTVTDALWTWGWWLVLLAVGLSLGLIIGAETTKLVIIDPTHLTPGLFGPSVAVGNGYLRWWEAAKALAIVGGGAMLAGYTAEKYLGG